MQRHYPRTERHLGEIMPPKTTHTPEQVAAELEQPVYNPEKDKGSGTNSDLARKAAVPKPDLSLEMLRPKRI